MRNEVKGMEGFARCGSHWKLVSEERWWEGDVRRRRGGGLGHEIGRGWLLQLHGDEMVIGVMVVGVGDDRM